MNGYETQFKLIINRQQLDSAFKRHSLPVLILITVSALQNSSLNTEYSWNKYLAYRCKNCADQTLATLDCCPPTPGHSEIIPSPPGVAV